jgi:hypothetical protein
LKISRNHEDEVAALPELWWGRLFGWDVDHAKNGETAARCPGDLATNQKTHAKSKNITSSRRLVLRRSAHRTRKFIHSLIDELFYNHSRGLAVAITS